MRLLITMIIHNEASRYLRPVLNNALKYADVLVLDDASTDSSADLAADLGATVIRRAASANRLVVDESALRHEFWETAQAGNPEWIMALDGDEILFPESVERLESLMDTNDVVGAQWWHAWGMRGWHRIDGFWNPIKSRGPIAVKTSSVEDSTYREMPIHGGRFPRIVEAHEYPINIYHLGYRDKADWARKRAHYQKFDPNGVYSVLSHYNSIVTPATLAKIPFDLPEGV